MIFALDAMGGDFAPQAIVQGALDALDNTSESLTLILLGDETAIKQELGDHSPSSIKVIHTDEIVTMEERLTKQELFLDEDAVRSAKADIVRKQDEYRQKLQVGQESLMEKQKELLEPILQEVKDLIIQIGKQEKYSLILDKQAAMFVESKYDLTDSLIQQLNQKYKKDKQNKEKSNE